MTEQQKHLQQVLEQQQQVIAEVNNLNNQLNVKRELATKLQGVIEYLQQTGVTLPTPEETEVETEKKQEVTKESPKAE
jgi:hypothetical protein